MKQFSGYLKNTIGDTSVLLAGGGSKPLSEFKIGDYLPLTGGEITGQITINRGADAGALNLKYGNSVYDVIHTHNNGNVSINACGDSLYLGYFNTNAIYARGNYVNLDSGNYSNYALPLSGGTMSGDINMNNHSITNLKIGGGIYWNPYVESSSDGSDYARIYLSNSGVAGGTTLILEQLNDSNDTIQFVTNSSASLYHNSNIILTSGNYSSYALPLNGGTMIGALTIKGVADTGQYSQGGFNKAYANIILQGDNTYGVSGIVFKSMKGNDTDINTPSDVAFIQYHPMGVTAAPYGTTPTEASSGETSRLVIGIGNDSNTPTSSVGEELWLQTAGANDLKHYVVDTGYIIWDAGNDGSGSGLDADLLDGNHGSYYYQRHSWPEEGSVDLNFSDYYQSGIRSDEWGFSGASNVTNRPYDAATVYTFPGYCGIQLGKYYYGHEYKIRGRYNGTYESWVTLIHSANIGSLSVNYASSAGSVAWNNVSSKPFTGTTFNSGDNSNHTHDCNEAWQNGVYYYYSNGPSGLGESTGDGALYVLNYSSSWVAQIAQDYRNGHLFVRGKNGGSWQAWKRIIDSDNISSQSVNYANSAGNADTVDSLHFTYSNTDNNPTYLWGTNSNGSSILAHRASMSVNYATSAGSATTAYSPYGFSFSDRSSSDWTGVPGTFITDWSHSGGSGADIMFKYNGGALNVITDGYFYQGIDYRGASYRVLDEYDITHTNWGNADTVDSLHIHSGRNNEANKLVRTDGYGYIQAGYINSSDGDENNNSSPNRVWGTNGSDSYLRTYSTSALSVGNASTIDGKPWDYLCSSSGHTGIRYGGDWPALIEIATGENLRNMFYNYPIDYILVERSTDGSTWTDSKVESDVKNLLGGTYQSNYTINSGSYLRFTLKAGGAYFFINFMFIHITQAGSGFQMKIEHKDGDGAYTTINDWFGIGGWPGTYQINFGNRRMTGNGEFRVTYRSTASNANYLYKMHIYGGYPFGLNSLISVDGFGVIRSNVNTSSISCTTLNGYTPITSGNIGSQSVNYANSAGNADTVDGLHASDFIRNLGGDGGSISGFYNTASSNKAYYWGFDGGGSNTYAVHWTNLLAGYASNADTVDGEHAYQFAHRGTANNLLCAGNEFNFLSAGFSGGVWFNYLDENRNNGASVTAYYLGNGHSGYSDTTLYLGYLNAAGSISSSSTISSSGTIYSSGLPAFLTNVGTGNWNYIRIHNGSYLWDIASNTNSIADGLEIRPSGGTSQCTFYIDGHVTFRTDVYAANYYTTSDIRKKIIISNSQYKVEDYALIPLIRFRWKDNDSILLGTVALQVNIPELISGDETLSVNYSVLGTLAGVEACKEIVKLKERIKELEEKLYGTNS